MIITRHWLSICAACLAGLSAVAAGQVETQDSKTPHVRSEMLVSSDWLASHLGDRDLVILCIASSADFCANGRIPGAQYLPLSAIAITRDGIPNELPPIAELVRTFESVGVSNSSRIILYSERRGLF